MTTTVNHLMTAANPIAALAARVGSDEEFVGQLTHAVHQNDKATLQQQLLASAGAKGATVTIEQKAGAAAQKTIISVHLDLGPIHISVDVKK